MQHTTNSDKEPLQNFSKWIESDSLKSQSTWCVFWKGFKRLNLFCKPNFCRRLVPKYSSPNQSLTVTASNVFFYDTQNKHSFHSVCYCRHYLCVRCGRIMGKTTVLRCQTWSWLCETSSRSTTSVWLRPRVPETSKTLKTSTPL